MTRVGFYVVQAAEPGQRLSVAVRLADKALADHAAKFAEKHKKVDLKPAELLKISTVAPRGAAGK